MKKTVPSKYAVVKFESTKELVEKLDVRIKKLTYFEVVGHSTPQTCSVWNFSNVSVLAKAIVSSTQKSSLVVLSGCNTMACTYGPNIAEKLASETERKVAGTLGYIKEGTYRHGKVKCTRDNEDPESSPVFCGTKTEVGSGCYAVAKPAAFPKFYETKIDNSRVFDVNDPTIQVISNTLKDIIAATLSHNKLYTKPLNPFIGPDIKIRLGAKEYWFYNDIHLLFSVEDRKIYRVKTDFQSRGDVRSFYVPFLPNER